MPGRPVTSTPARGTRSVSAALAPLDRTISVSRLTTMLVNPVTGWARAMTRALAENTPTSPRTVTSATVVEVGATTGPEE